MSTDGLDIVLSWLEGDFRSLSAQADADLGATRDTSARLDVAQERLHRIANAVVAEEVKASAPVASPARPTRGEPDVDWNRLRTDAEGRLRERGVDLDAVCVDDLLDPEEVDRITRRFSVSFRIETKLDRYDVAAIVAAGLVGAIVDLLIVRIPRDMTYLGAYRQRGSPLTTWLRSEKFSLPADNQLAQWFKVSFDQVKGVHVSGFFPGSHRLQTPGHDPLVGLVIGVIDIMRGGLTAFDLQGHAHFIGETGEPVFNPFEALVMEIGHLLSDGFTKMGIPAPGWSLLQVLQVGSFGKNERTVAELARFMYLKGYDSRHFLTMGASVAAAEIVLRGYFLSRQWLDPEYREATEREAHLAASSRIGGHPRYQSMALGAHFIATAANAGKVMLHKGNPLAINYAQWLWFLRQAFKVYRTSMTPPSEVLMRQGGWGLRALEEGWPEIDAGALPRVGMGEPRDL